jgi:small GTP-binding protein
MGGKSSSEAGPGPEQVGKDRFQEKDTFKVLMTGASNVGVTSLFRRTLEHAYHGDYFPSSKCSIGLKVFEGVHSRYSLELWDIPSAPAVKEFMQESYLDNVDGVIIVVDSTDLKSYNDVDSWLETFRKNLTYEIPIVLLANKCDSDSSILKQEDVDFSVTKYKLNGGFLVSALKAHGLDEAFQFMLGQLVQTKSTRKYLQQKEQTLKHEEAKTIKREKRKVREKKARQSVALLSPNVLHRNDRNKAISRGVSPVVSSNEPRDGVSGLERKDAALLNTQAVDVTEEDKNEAKKKKMKKKKSKKKKSGRPTSSSSRPLSS